MRKARIFRNGTKATQAGKARQDLWILQAEPKEGKRPDPLMGWAGSSDTATQLRLVFPSREAAEAYAARNDLDAEVLTAHRKPLILQSYADNFR
jgi:hypothetical protein